MQSIKLQRKHWQPAAAWTNTADSKSPDDKLVEVFVEMVQDAVGGCAPSIYQYQHTAHFKVRGFLRL